MAAAFALSLDAHATVLGFEDAEFEGIVPAVYTVDGYQIKVNNWIEGIASIGNGNGTNTLSFCAYDDAACYPGVFLTLTGSSPFSLTGLEASTRFGNGTLDFVGHFAGGTTYSTSVTASEGSFSAFTLAGLTGLASLDIILTGAFSAEIDNLQLAAAAPPTGEAPEPATLALMGAALLGLGVAHRRRG